MVSTSFRPLDGWSLFRDSCHIFAEHRAYQVDGRWITYASNESGQWEIYVAAFPSLGSRRQVSNAGGMGPVWRADGKELFYLSTVGKLMSVGFKGGAQPETSVPVELFQTRLRADNRYNQYTVTGDGQRFLVYEPDFSGMLVIPEIGAARSGSVNLVLFGRRVSGTARKYHARFAISFAWAP